MKKLLLLIFFSGSLDGFSQDSNLMRTNDVKDWERAVYNVPSTPKPDTLRAIVLVTLFQNGPAHARMGYVVIQDGRKPVYLDCQKKALKLPQVGWGYVEVNPNVKQKQCQ